MFLFCFFPPVGFWLSFMRTSFPSPRTYLPPKRITVWSSRGPSAETKASFPLCPSWLPRSFHFFFIFFLVLALSNFLSLKDLVVCLSTFFFPFFFWTWSLQKGRLHPAVQLASIDRCESRAVFPFAQTKSFFDFPFSRPLPCSRFPSFWLFLLFATKATRTTSLGLVWTMKPSCKLGLLLMNTKASGVFSFYRSLRCSGSYSVNDPKVTIWAGDLWFGLFI